MSYEDQSIASLRPALSQGQGTTIIAFDPTFGSFSLLELVSQLHESVSLVKVFRLFKLEQMFFWCSECAHNR